MAKSIAPRVGTIGDLVDHKRTVWLDCEKCGHAAQFDPAAIAERYGRALPVQRFLERSYCSGCRARYPHVSLIVPPAATGGSPGRASGV